ncbi:MAG: RelA/SpoT domain-containing protein [Rhodobacter sp.]|nr:RelA/SpoT domain-containing protein [Rhodobacter sp.]
MADLQNYRAFRMRCLATTLGIVDRCKAPPNAVVSVRLKRLDSIRRKLNRSSANFTLGRLDDVIGVRVICQSLQDVLDFGSRIKQVPGSRMKDYIATPADTGYRGVHGILAFSQPAGSGVELRARFEIQVRTHLQHWWAVWSEAHGEAVKVGAGNSEDHGRLRQVSEKIAEWEMGNRDAVPFELPQYVGRRSLAVCWRSEHGPTALEYFEDDVGEALKWLQYLEERHPERRREALLLVGVAEHSDTERLIKTTHPLYTGVRILDPTHWMPDGSLD